MKPNDVEIDLLNEIVNLREKLQSVRSQSREVNLIKYSVEVKLPLSTPLPLITPVYQLKAHNSKVHDVVWTNNDKYVLTIGAEGCVVLWEAQTGLIHNVIDASSIQPITAAANNDSERLFCGGLCANVVLFTSKHQSAEDGYSIYETNLVYEHSGQVNSIICLGNTHILTTSSIDGALIWDVEKVKIIGRYPHTTAEVQSICLLRQDGTTFLTGDGEGMIRQWDSRQSGNMICAFEPHESDVNCVKALPNGYNFITGSEDTYVHLYDIRTDIILAKYHDPQSASNQATLDPDVSVGTQSEELSRPPSASVSDLAVSHSGRLILSGCKDSILYYWDLSQPENCIHHEVEIGPIIRIAMSNNKTALVMMTWDAKTRIRIMRPK